MESNRNNSLIRDIVFGTRRERIVTDGLTIGGIICPLIKMHHWNVFLYGAGEEISSVILYLWNLGIEIEGVFDCDIRKEGKKILGRIPVIYPYHITERYESENTFVIINTIYFKEIEQSEILHLLFEIGITKFYELTQNEKKEIKAKPHPWADIGRIDYYRDHIEELENTYDLLYDKKSKEIMLEYVRTYVEFGAYRLEQCSGKIKYFYGQNSDGSKEELYSHLSEEVWVNCGSSIGDNVFWYFANGLKAKCIYAYEADEKVYERLVKNLKYLPQSYADKVYAVNEFIGDKTNWKVLKKDKITLINADIEGEELNLLKSMKNIIVSDRPVLAICAYHKAEDLTVMPQYISQIVDDYCLVLRKYESNVENVRRTAELVLYAIPRERLLTNYEQQ